MSDRIFVHFEAGEKLSAIVKAKLAYLESELLAKASDAPLADPDYTGKLEVDGETVTVQMKKQ